MIKLGSATLAGAAIFPPTVYSSPNPTKALYWHPLGQSVVCELCPHKCVLKNNETGRCRTRQNLNGDLVTNAYANPCAIHTDPIEKKPFYHFLPATRAFSLAIAGCNLRCLNCQNSTISQHRPDETETSYLPPDMAVAQAAAQGCTSIAYTYSEPIVWFEYVLDVAKKARAAGLKNIMVTAGYINEAPLGELLHYMDAITLDIKSFSESVYRNLNAGSLEPVLNSLLMAQKSNVWVEISSLIIPGWTDDFTKVRKLCGWIKQKMGADVPLHFLRFFPLYKLADLYPTPIDTLKIAQKIAHEEGLNYVYIGNVAETDSNTYCPVCKKPLVIRDGFLIKTNLIKNRLCPFCKSNIKGIWTL
jgi:pyruvate formate lyase activating enzyme